MLIGLITRCKDEYFIEEFCTYYLSQGVDTVYIIDDNSNDKTIYDNVVNNKRIEIRYEKDIIKNNYANSLYHEIKDSFDWMICVDVDEFIATKRNPNYIIRDELESTFKAFDCVKIPWVMMSCNSVEKSPERILEENLYRWNHDLTHENKTSTEHKFRCRFDRIEVKCIFRPRRFNDITDHHPINPIENTSVVDGICCRLSELDPFYDQLREEDIRNGFLLCYHYRIISIDNSRKKIRTNTWYLNYSLQDLMSSDYNEIFDDTLRVKSLKSRIKFVHITKNAGTSIEKTGKRSGALWGIYDDVIKNQKTLFAVNPAYWHTPIRLFEKNPYSKNIILFTVVRNPYDRIVSECFCKWGGKYKIKEFSNAEDFNDYITERVERCHSYDFFHFTPQYLYTHNESDEQIIDHILRYENLEDEFNSLMKSYDLNIRLDTHENKANKLYAVKDINQKNIDLINKTYHKDFVLFGYRKLG